MKCKKCKTENITKANYCKHCANKFTEKEQQDAINKTYIGIFNTIEKVYDTITLKKITGHIAYKIISFLIVLGIGIYFWINYGLNVRFIKSDHYEIQYNEKLNEYYLITNENEISLNLYIPNRTDKLSITHYDIEGSKLETIDYKKDEEIILEAQDLEYYVLKSHYLHDKNDDFKIYVLKEE